MRPDWLKSLSPELPVLIAGPTASGKSALALEIAADQGGVVVNADALQVFGNWHILTARPGRDEESVAPHLLYGHVPGDASYSVGHWLRDLAPVLQGEARAIVVGGTGLYFTALTEGLADIPPTPAEIRAEADARIRAEGHLGMLDELDQDTGARIDALNPARVQRAWEVWRSTGKVLAAWQDETPEPVLPLQAAQTLLIQTERDWLAARIGRRFDAMIADGAVEETRRNLPGWDPALPSSRAIGARELIDHLLGNRDLKDAVAAGKTSTRQYAKRQRTWFRSKMRAWRSILLP
ncbi:MAG: tRNA (adenosine(37)-N6)-dimethylallyltransferase MiaA [Rhodobacteraceae bacterium]|nr:tRNA (adenosine(37)-N6)-dimethylallyltransferase MiaA [Paracoccaceae bacterium]